MKRFTDTEIWDKGWFMKLSIKEKCLVRFLFDKCDNIGLWSPNWEIASAYIGEKVAYEDLVNFAYRLDFIGNKIFIKDFCEFQYGKLTETCKPHRPIIEKLKKLGLYESVMKGYQYPIERVQEKEKDQEKDCIEIISNGVGFEKMEPHDSKYYNPENSESIIPQMKEIFLQENPKYRFSDEDAPLFRIAEYLSQGQPIEHLARDRIKIILEQWRGMSKTIAADSHYAGYSMAQVDKFKTGIFNKSQNPNAGTSNAKSKTFNKSAADRLWES